MPEDAESQYRSIVVIGKSPLPLWHWETWRQCVPVIAPLLAVCRDVVGVNSVQHVKGIDYNVCFGDLEWSPKGHLKWTHQSPLTREQSHSWTFRYTEIWAPDVEICGREALPPNLFLCIENPFAAGHARPGQFNQFVHLAVEETLYHVYNDVVRRAVKDIASLIDGVLTIAQITPWVSDEECVESLTNRPFRGQC